MQDTTISTVNSFIYEIQVNNNNLYHCDNAKARMKFNFYGCIFKLRQNSLGILSGVEHSLENGLCNKLLEYSFQLRQGKVV